MGAPFNQQSKINAVSAVEVKSQLITDTDGIATGTTKTYHLYPVSNVLARVNSLRIILPFANSTSGTVRVYLSAVGSILHLDCTADASVDNLIEFRCGNFVKEYQEMQPRTPEAQAVSMANMVITENAPLVITITNSSNGIIDEARYFYIAYDEEKIL